jgi:hypothetical protein
LQVESENQLLKVKNAHLLNLLTVLIGHAFDQIHAAFKLICKQVGVSF